MPNERYILHVDMDAFFASIEQRDHPEWKGKPVIVGAGPHERGVVSTCSYEARKFGVHSAMPSREAGRLCPHGIFVRPRMAHYMKVSHQVFAILERYTPWIEGLSCDEAFLDVSGATRLFGPPPDIAARIRADVRAELRLTCSVGVAHNMFLAKLASDMNKPDGMTLVPEGAEAIRDFLAPLPVTRLWGVGRVTAETLHASGFRTIRDLQRCDLPRLTALLGDSLAHHLHRLSFGLDDRDLCQDAEEKSVSREHTFGEDTHDVPLLLQTLRDLARDVAQTTRRNGTYATVGKLKLRWENFKTMTRQRQFTTPSCDDFTFREMAETLFREAYRGGDIRLIGFGVAGFLHERIEQPTLFEEAISPRQRKRERLSRTLDALHDKGKGEVSIGVE